MSGARLRSILPVVLLTVAGLLSLEIARAQETWQPAHGGAASSWGAGATTSAASVPRAGAFGGGSGWGAGKESFGAKSQPGGVWHEGPAMSTSTNRNAARGIAAGTLPSFQTAKPAGVSPAPATGSSGVPRGKAQISHSFISPRFGMANGGRGAASKLSSARSAASSFRGRATASRRSGTNSAFGSLTQSAPVSNPLASPSSSDTLGLGAQTGLGDILH